MKVAVIGGGALGVSSASWLLRDGHEVTIIDPDPIAQGSSFGNAGCLNLSSVVPMSLPGNISKVPGWLLDPLGPLAIRWRYLPQITPWLIRFLRAGTSARVGEQAAALRDLLHDSVALTSELAQWAGAQDLIRRQGHLVVYRSREAFEGDAYGWRLRRDNGIVFDTLGQDEVWQLEPSLSKDCRIGLYFPGNGHTTNPNRLINSWADAFQRDGGTITRARATAFEFEGTTLRGVLSNHGTIAADAAVIAAGAYSKPLAGQLGDVLPLDTERGYHVIVREPEAMPRLPVMDAEGKFVATPMETGLRLAGTVEFAGLDAAPDWRRADKLLTLGQRLFPALQSRYSEDRLSRWMGRRPSMPDSLPVIGLSRRCPQIAYAFGHGHVGLAACARTGLLVAELLGERTPSISLKPFSPRRFDSLASK
ncbi:MULTISPECIES: FAD-binding oxidoreductase [unclassified Acidisoma]|uniref:NAD(P)/FAD-dependent oxidoreductase n=1 Tax=unclassified Acidisoma TaxID=2634065 RepID=UPI00131B0DFF|nr:MULTISPECIES: FAD-dependent oxidoreductase [unclassified Acidisoma]